MSRVEPISDLFDVSGLVVVVTGAAGGMGRYLATELAARGARLVLTDADPDGLMCAHAALEGALAEAGDVTDAQFTERLVDSAEARFGHIDVLINCAAIGCHTAPHELAMDDWNRVVQVDLGGYFLASRDVARSMMRTGGSGSIINFSSIAGSTAVGRGNVAYSVAKAGVNQLTRELAIEWAAYRIRVNAIQPCQIETDSLLRLIRDGVADETALVAGIPLGRMAKPKDILGPVLFLAGAASEFVTGVTLPVDGGNLAMNAGATVPTLNPVRAVS